MKLLEIRKQLDKADKELIKIIRKRIFLIAKVAEHKKENNIQIFQPKREKNIILKIRKDSKKLGINPDLAENILKILIKESHKIQKEIMNK